MTNPSLPNATALRDLLNTLGLHLTYNTLPPFHTTQQRGPALMQTIHLSHRLARTHHNWQQVALIEFHKGLYHMEWGEFTGAAYDFKNAQRQSRRTQKPLLSHLARFAEATMHHRTYNHELAAQQYHHVQEKINMCLRKLRGHGLHPHHDQDRHFIIALDKAITLAQSSLYQTLSRPWREAPPPQERGSPTIPIPNDNEAEEEVDNPHHEEPIIQPPHIPIHAPEPSPSYDDDLTPIVEEERTPYNPVYNAIQLPYSNLPTIDPSPAGHHPLPHQLPPPPNPVINYIQLSPDMKLVPITEAETYYQHLIPDLQIGDHLLVDTRTLKYQYNELIIVGDEEAGGQNPKQFGTRISLNRHGLFMARFINHTDTNRIEFVADNADPQIGNRNRIVGSVIGYFRPMPPSEAAYDLSPPTHTQPLVLTGFKEPPCPTYFTPGEGTEIFYVNKRDPSQFMKNTRPGDTLIVYKEKPSLTHGEFVVLNGQLQGSIHLTPFDKPLVSQQYYAAQYFLDPNTNRPFFINDGSPLVEYSPNLLIMGAIIGYFRFFETIE